MFFKETFPKIEVTVIIDRFLSITQGEPLSSVASLARKGIRLDGVIERHQKVLDRLQSWRLAFGLGVFALLVASQVAKGLHLELIALFLILPAFVVLFRRSRRVGVFLQRLQLLKSFYQEQWDFNQGLISNATRPEDMFDVNLARDLDLGYFFRAIDRCFSLQGQSLLNHWLCQDFKASDRATREQNIKKLTEYPGTLRRLQLQPPARLIDFARIENEVRRSFFEDSMKWKWVVPLSWLALIVALIFALPSLMWKVALLVYVGSVLNFIGRTQHVFSRLQDLHADFTSLGERILILEKLAQRLPHCQALHKRQASQDVRQLNRLISLMSMKTNPILFYILNLLAPWDFLLAELAERSRKKLFLHFQDWSLEVVEIEACASLANLKIYHDTQWAEAGNTFVDVQGLAHPLLNQKTVVTNDFSPNDNNVIIITGSNMSGKSTFLRALGINFCLANIGAPVFAKRFLFKPMPLASCIRVSDSLRDGQSYFYAEVQRMKMILDKARQQEILFLIDEPLRGTNNRERLIGNQKYLQQILEANAYGFISTHDLELTALADDSPKIVNYHFSEQWDQTDLLFDYKIKDGPSQSTNALKILEREGLLRP